MNRALQERLRRALDDREFQVHYQPQFRLDTSELRGVEALLRWRTPGGVWIPPASFVPMLEETSLIGEVGTWVFERAAADDSWWRGRGLDIGRIGVNVSPLQLRSDEFFAWMLRQAGSWNAQGTAIDIELTESAVLSKPERMVAEMEKLVEANVRFALDDFGMGYSSLDLLMRLPVSYLKIDRSFVGGMLTSCKAETLVEAIVRIGHEIGVETIAEGVETAQQLQRLWELGCGIGQGHYFSPALPRDQLFEWLRSQPSFEKPRSTPGSDERATSGRHRNVAAMIAAAGHDIT